MGDVFGRGGALAVTLSPTPPCIIHTRITLTTECSVLSAPPLVAAAAPSPAADVFPHDGFIFNFFNFFPITPRLERAASLCVRALPFDVLIDVRACFRFTPTAPAGTRGRGLLPPFRRRLPARVMVCLDLMTAQTRKKDKSPTPQPRPFSVSANLLLLLFHLKLKHTTQASTRLTLTLYDGVGSPCPRRWPARDIHAITSSAALHHRHQRAAALPR